MPIADHIRQLFQRAAQWSAPDVDSTVRRHWDRRAAGQKSVFHLREFEDDMWRRGLRLAKTPFEHHLAMMQLFKKEFAPKLEPASNARRGAASAAPASQPASQPA